MNAWADGSADSAVAFFLAWSGTSGAVELLLGLGMDDALGGNGTTAPAAAVELRTDPMWARGRFDAGVGAAIEADADGDVWLGFGPFGGRRCLGSSGSRRA